MFIYVIIFNLFHMVTFVYNVGKCLYFQNSSKLQAVFSVWSSLSYHFCRTAKFILCDPDHKMCIYTDNICNRKYFRSHSLCVSQNMKHCVYNLWEKYIILNIVSVVNALLYCNSVFPLRQFHRHVGTPTWPAAAFPHSSCPSNIPLLAPNTTTTTYSKRRETGNHVGVPTDPSVALSFLW